MVSSNYDIGDLAGHYMLIVHTSEMMKVTMYIWTVIIRTLAKPIIYTSGTGNYICVTEHHMDMSAWIRYSQVVR